MPLRVDDGVSIPLAAPGPTSGLPGGLIELMKALPEEALPVPGLPGRRLNVPHFRQLKELWCWAACAQMVLRFFGRSLRQCDIARLQLNKACCRPSAPASFCDEGRTLGQIDRAFEGAGLAGLRLDEPLSFTDIENEIGGDSPRPVVAGIKWAGGGGGSPLGGEQPSPRAGADSQPTPAGAQAAGDARPEQAPTGRNGGRGDAAAVVSFVLTPGLVRDSGARMLSVPRALPPSSCDSTSRQAPSRVTAP